MAHENDILLEHLPRLEPPDCGIGDRVPLREDRQWCYILIQAENGFGKAKHLLLLGLQLIRPVSARRYLNVYHA